MQLRCAGRHLSVAGTASVARRVEKLFGSKQAARYFPWEMVPLSKKEQSALPPSRRGCMLPAHRFVFRFDLDARKQDETYDGYSVLVTTVPQKDDSADSLFTKFEQQNYCEHVNREFKGPVAIRPIFLHSPQRVEALVFLLLIALTAYFLLQRIYRQSLSKRAMPKERRTTTETILRAFNSYVLLIHRTRLGREVQPTRLSYSQRELLQHLGFPSPV